MDKKYRRNIAVSYLFRFLASLALGDGIWVLYLLRKGLTLWQVGVLEGVFHIAGLVSEVPSGALADLFGRKGAMLVSRVLAAASTLVTIYANSMGPLTAAFVLNAWSYNLLSGSDEALLYDSFLCLGRERQYFRAAGRMALAAEIAQAAGVLAGGILARRSYALCYFVSAGIQAVTFFAGAFLTEPRRVRRRPCYGPGPLCRQLCPAAGQTAAAHAAALRRPVRWVHHGLFLRPAALP